MLGPGFYFTEDPDEGSKYATRQSDPFRSNFQGGAPGVYPVYLRVTNHFYADSFFKRLASKGTWKDPRTALGYDFYKDILGGGGKEATEHLKKLGYDGVREGHHWIVFFPNQAKSVYNKGGCNLQSDELGENYEDNPY